MNEPGKETEDFKKDIIAAACLSECRKLCRAVLKARYVPLDRRTTAKIEEEFLHCINGYAQEHQVWGTSMNKNGDVYYFNRETGKSQWDRPQKLAEDIKNGLAVQEYEEPWERCEYLHIQLMQCERTSQVHTMTGCVKEGEKLTNCMAQFLGTARPQEDEEEDDDYF